MAWVFGIAIGRCSGSQLSTTLVHCYFPIHFFFIYFSVTIISHRAAAPIKNLQGIPKEMPLRLLSLAIIIYIIWKLGFVAPSGVYKHFCTIPRNQDKNKTIGFQEFDIMNNITSWNLILPRLIPNLLIYEYFGRLGFIPF